MVIGAIFFIALVYAGTPSKDNEHKFILNNEELSWIQTLKEPFKVGITQIPNQVLKDKNGKYKGFAIDIYEQISKLSGIKFEYIYYDSWDKVLEAGKKREIDIVFLAQRTPSRFNYFEFTDAVLQAQNNIIVQSYSPIDNIEEEISEAYPDVEIKTITKPIAKLSILSIESATRVKMKIKAREKAGIVKAKVSISHDMLTYAQAKKKGREANFITHIAGVVGKNVVYDASTSQFLSKNPLMKFSFKGKKGDILTIIYQDLKGKTFYDSKKIK